MNYTIEPEWLKQHLKDSDIVIADCRFSLKDPTLGRKDYEKSHIPGAVYFDLNKDLSGPISAHGGRHPLPDLDTFKVTLEKAGISNQTTVVAYDGGEGAFAARLWWLLQYVGHEKVFVLNGGFSGWEKEGCPVEAVTPMRKSTSFSIKINSEILAEYEDVECAVAQPDQQIVLIDSREEKRYLGIEEPIDKKAGHIPGAVNKVWTDSFHNGKYISPEDQEQRFSEISKEKEIIVYCGSGVTAAPNFIALKKAGYKHVKLYVGSFSDWISYDGNKIISVNKK